MSELNVVAAKAQATTGIVNLDEDVQASFVGAGPTDTVQPQAEDVGHICTSLRFTVANYLPVIA